MDPSGLLRDKSSGYPSRSHSDNTTWLNLLYIYNVFQVCSVVWGIGGKGLGKTLGLKTQDTVAIKYSK